MTAKQSSRDVARSGLWILAVQVVIGFGQFVYAGITSRIFLPADLGSFAAALSLYGILLLIGSTGPASFILRERELHLQSWRQILVINVIGSGLTSAAFFFLLPWWVIILKSPEALQFRWLLSAALLISPFATTASAFFRRQGRAVVDGMILLIAFCSSSLVGVVLIFWTQELWALASATLMNQVVILFACRLLSSKLDVVSGQGVGFKRIIRYSRDVLAQNAGFLALQQIPLWMIGAILGPTALGHFSRANTLTSLPATSMASAINRVLQPTYRNFASASSRSLAVTDATLLASALAFPIFSTLSAIGPAVIYLWLGPGWELAGDLVWLLAIAFAFQIPYTVLAGDFELQGRFAPARWSQLSMLVSIALGMGLFGSTADLRWAAAAILASQLLGFLTLCIFRSKRRLILGLGAQIGLAAIMYGFVEFAITMVAQWAAAPQGLEALLECGTAIASALIFVLLTLKINPGYLILRERGVTKRQAR